ncbi:MAG: nuclear transport factor 2 family protein [Acidimicrobiia bacterium]
MATSRDQIERLMFHYARCVDSADWDGLGEMFAKGRVRTNTSEDVADGGDAIAALWRGLNKVHEDGTLRTRHLLTNLMFDVDDDDGHAVVDSYFMVFQQTPRIPLQPIAGGRYCDTFVRDGATWRFEEKFIWVDHVGDTSDHLVVDLAEPVRFDYGE